MHVERTLFAFLITLFAAMLLSTCVDHALAEVKRRPKTESKDETIERLSTELKLRGGELAVVRGQLTACRRRCVEE